MVMLMFLFATILQKALLINFISNAARKKLKRTNLNESNDNKKLQNKFY